MGAAITSALALCRAFRIALFGMWVVQSCVRFRFSRLFFIFMACAWATDELCGGVLFWHHTFPLI